MQPVIIVFINGLKLLFVNRHSLVKALCIPFFILVLVEFYGPSNEEGIEQFIGGSLDFIAYCYAAIITHRVLLLGADSVPIYGLYKPTSREFVFAGHFLGIGIIVSPILIVLSLIPDAFFEIVIPVIVVLFLYLMCRISLVFPAIAVGKNWSYTESWRATRNFKIISIFTIGLFPIGSSGVLMCIANLVEVQLLTAILSTFSTVLIVAVLSSTYQHIHERTSVD